MNDEMLQPVSWRSLLLPALLGVVVGVAFAQPVRALIAFLARIFGS